MDACNILCHLVHASHISPCLNTDTIHIPRKIENCELEQIHTQRSVNSEPQCGFKENKSFLFHMEKNSQCHAQFICIAQHICCFAFVFSSFYVWKMHYSDGWLDGCMNEWVSSLHSLTHHHFPVTQIIVHKAKCQNWSVISCSHAPRSIVYVRTFTL